MQSTGDGRLPSTGGGYTGDFLRRPRLHGRLPSAAVTRATSLGGGYTGDFLRRAVVTRATSFGGRGYTGELLRRAVVTHRLVNR